MLGKKISRQKYRHSFLDYSSLSICDFFDCSDAWLLSAVLARLQATELLIKKKKKKENQNGSSFDTLLAILSALCIYIHWIMWEQDPGSHPCAILPFFFVIKWHRNDSKSSWPWRSSLVCTWTTGAREALWNFKSPSPFTILLKRYFWLWKVWWAPRVKSQLSRVVTTCLSE